MIIDDELKNALDKLFDNDPNCHGPGWFHSCAFCGAAVPTSDDDHDVDCEWIVTKHHWRIWLEANDVER